MPAERDRLRAADAGDEAWRWWGPYLADRQWGTVREDYSPDGSAWDYFTHDAARSRAYRWGEDGLGGICDRWQHLCFAFALWNGADPFLKERLFGLTNTQGNHGEDVKEYYWPVDSTPTHSWMRWHYKYPQAAFPYELLLAETARRGRADPEFELLDTGVFDEDRYFDVEITYAKAAPQDICIVIECTNRGPEAAPLHILPTAWFRNTWSWGRDERRPRLSSDARGRVRCEHATLGDRWLIAEGSPELLFTENETNARRIFRRRVPPAPAKDAINDLIVQAVAIPGDPRSGTKVAAWYFDEVAAGESVRVRLRLADRRLRHTDLEADFDRIVTARRKEADAFYRSLSRHVPSEELRSIQRRAFAGLLWTKQYYRYHVAEWLEGDPTSPPPAKRRAVARNATWRHLANTDIISMPDSWEYPWYASWDLAFHMLPFALIDPEFAKSQLLLLCREWYMHPNGQLPAYEWNFGDVNPPVHAWAAWRVFKIDAKHSGRKDHQFLKRIFHKLLINFTWWINRKDPEGNNVFEGGFLGLDNIGPFDRSRPLPEGTRLEQADASSWVAMFCLNMLAISLELAAEDRAYEDVATKFFEHFMGVASAMNRQDGGLVLWDDDDGFFYDVLQHETSRPVALKVRSIVGLIPLFAVETLDERILERLPDFRDRMEWFVQHRPDLCGSMLDAERGGRRLLSVLDRTTLVRVLDKILDEDRFLSPHGIRSLSREHAERPLRIRLAGEVHEVRYEPAESSSATFGGNSNWRGPVWFPINYLLIESLQKFHHHYGGSVRAAMPTGSGRELDLRAIAAELSRRLIDLFTVDDDGRRPCNGGRSVMDSDPHWREHVDFHEYFHGETGAGLGAAHQTGWTALVAKLIDQVH